jgi:multidrug transporter EmrE-like cation transporter
MKAAALLLALVCVLMSSAAQLLMKLGLNGAAAKADGTVGAAAGSSASASLFSTYAQAFSSPWVWAGLGLYGLSAALWIWVLSRLDVGLAYPLVSLGFVFTLGAGVLWLGEPFSWQRVAACGLIVAGVLLLAADA